MLLLHWGPPLLKGESEGLTYPATSKARDKLRAATSDLVLGRATDVPSESIAPGSFRGDGRGRTQPADARCAFCEWGRKRNLPLAFHNLRSFILQDDDFAERTEERKERSISQRRESVRLYCLTTYYILLIGFLYLFWTSFSSDTYFSKHRNQNMQAPRRHQCRNINVEIPCGVIIITHFYFQGPKGSLGDKGERGEPGSNVSFELK